MTKKNKQKAANNNAYQTEFGTDTNVGANAANKASQKSTNQSHR